MTQMEQSTTIVERTRVFIVDDHPIVRQGLAQMINQEADLMVCGEAEDAQNALQAVAELHPDLVLIDLSLKGGSGLDLIRALRTRQSMLPVLVVSMHDESLYVERALRAGARGCKRSQECHEGTNLAQVGRRADRAHIAVRAAVIAAHRITSSAWKRMDEGSVRPRAWAVLRLMTNSNLVGLSTGSSAGLVPFRILST